MNERPLKLMCRGNRPQSCTFGEIFSTVGPPFPVRIFHIFGRIIREYGKFVCSPYRPGALQTIFAGRHGPFNPKSHERNPH